MGIRHIVRIVVSAWLSAQVELHGQYSLDRLRSFHTYASTIGPSWVVVICAVTPIPCFLLNTVMDFVPLKKPSAGPEANYIFWIRFFLSVTLITYGVLMQFIHLIPSLGMTRRHVFLFAVVASFVSLCFNFGMAHLIAFPVPYMLLVGTPIWFVSNAIMFLYFYGGHLRQDSELLKHFVSTMAILVCQVGLTVVYPIFILGLVSIPKEYYSLYVVLLPVIKISAKNIISMFVGSNHDMKPEVVIFNVEIFNALYVSLAMQNSSTISTTLILFAIDFVQAWASMADVHREFRQLKSLMSKIPGSHPLYGRSFLDVALNLVDEGAFVPDNHLKNCSTTLPQDERSLCGEDSVQADNCEVDSDISSMPKYQTHYLLPHDVKKKVAGINGKTKINSVQVVPITRAASSYRVDTSSFSRLISWKNNHGMLHSLSQKAVVRGMTPKRRLLEDIFTETERMQFVRVSTELLYTTEFIILIEYTEVIVPIIYSLYMTAMFFLPNQTFFPHISEIDAAELGRMVSNVLLYAGLELLSFLVMSMLLRRTVGISALHQLGYVLQVQWEMVQSKLLLWIFYSLQNSLEHFGADFTFKFAWMNQPDDD